MTQPTRLHESLERVLGTRSAAAFAKLEVTTVGELLRHYPRRYAAPGQFTPMAELRIGEHVTVMAQVRSATVRTMRSRGGAMLEAHVTDGSATLTLTFFAKRQGVLRAHESRLTPGRTGLFTGTVSEYRGKRQLTHPDYMLVGIDAADEDEAVLEASKPVPIYPATAQLPTWRIARAVRTVLDPLTEEDVPDPIPASIRERDNLPTLLAAWRAVHAPTDDEDWRAGQARLRYEEALVLQTVLAQRRTARDGLQAVARPGAAGALLDALDARLPFTLTAGQLDVGATIARDLHHSVPMLRLLQGDVGAGKTVVALRAMAQVVDSGGQAALLAPTEVLATQHYASVVDVLGDLAGGGTLAAADQATAVVLLTGSMGATARRQALAHIASGQAGIVIGTHALLSETVQFADLGLVVVDEQHRFGVHQRDVLRTRDAHTPHTLVMTATPIPRTLAMTVFGDVEISTLTDKPGNRGQVATHIVPTAKEAWVERAWARVREEVDAGGRVYVVCPRITAEDEAAEGFEEHDDALDTVDLDLGGARVALAAVEEVVERLRARPDLDGIRIGTMHGRLSSEDKDQAMRAFQDGTAPVLVATTVIEVGVDVPEATMMVVLNAERFGISQLHQLRGRIGRSDKSGVCLLLSGAPEDSLAHERLGALAATTDGFALAHTDLHLRREGDVLGSAQTGAKQSLKLLRVLRDADLIDKARTDARDLVGADPDLAEHQALAHAISHMVDPDREEFLERA